VTEASASSHFYQTQLVAMEGLVPTSEELPDLLDAISAEARRTGVELALIQPVGSRHHAAEEFYTRRRVWTLSTWHLRDVGANLPRHRRLPHPLSRRSASAII
jgi:hypothetical protein